MNVNYSLLFFCVIFLLVCSLGNDSLIPETHPDEGDDQQSGQMATLSNWGAANEAKSQIQFNRQSEKIVAAMKEMSADILLFMK